MTQEKEEYYPCIYRRLFTILGTLFEWLIKLFIAGIFGYVGITIVGAVYPAASGTISSVMKVIGTVIGVAVGNLLYVIVGIILILILHSAWKCSAEE